MNATGSTAGGSHETLYVSSRKRFVPIYNPLPDGSKELVLYCGLQEISFDEPDLFPWAETLVRQDSFMAGSATTWSTQPLDWPRVKGLLEIFARRGHRRACAAAEDHRAVAPERHAPALPRGGGDEAGHPRSALVEPGPRVRVARDRRPRPGSRLSRDGGAGAQGRPRRARPRGAAGRRDQRLPGVPAPQDRDRVEDVQLLRHPLPRRHADEHDGAPEHDHALEAAAARNPALSRGVPPPLSPASGRALEAGRAALPRLRDPGVAGLAAHALARPGAKRRSRSGPVLVVPRHRRRADGRRPHAGPRTGCRCCTMVRSRRAT